MSWCFLSRRPKRHCLGKNRIQPSPDLHLQTWLSCDVVLTVNLKRALQLWLIVFSSHWLSRLLTKFSEIETESAAWARHPPCVWEHPRYKPSAIGALGLGEGGDIPSGRTAGARLSLCIYFVSSALHKALWRQGSGPGTQWWLSGSL